MGMGGKKNCLHICITFIYLENSRTTVNKKTDRMSAMQSGALRQCKLFKKFNYGKILKMLN